MGAVGPIASGLSLANAGFRIGGELQRGEGAAQASEFEADRARRAAEFGRVRAGQTDVQLREDLNNTLANIRAVRASADMGDSPTQIAVEDEQRRIAERERANRVFGIQAQAREDEAAALYRRQVASRARRAATLGAVGIGLSSLSGAIPRGL